MNYIFFSFQDHEILIGNLAKEMGFRNVSLSSKVMSMIRIVPRGYTGKYFLRRNIWFDIFINNFNCSELLS